MSLPLGGWAAPTKPPSGGGESFPPSAQRHLASVFSLLSIAVLFAAMGCGGAIAAGLSQGGALVCVLTGALTLAALMCCSGAGTTPARISIFLLFTLLEGASLSTFVRLLSAALLFKALFCTAAIFMSFAGAALVAKRRSYLFLGGALSAGLSTLCIVGLVNAIFLRSPALVDAELIGGLFLFTGFIAYDTQAIAERASCAGSEPDALTDAAHLFLDALQLFIRIALLLARNGRGEGGGGSGGGSVSLGRGAEL